MGVISVGFGNYVAGDRVVAITSTESSPIRRIVQEARKKGVLIDATQGRRSKSVLFIDDGRILVSGLGPDTLAKRMDGALDAELG